MKRESRVWLIRHAIQGHCRWHENYPLREWQRWAYTLKAVVCILIGRKCSMWADSDVVDLIATWETHSWSNPDGDFVSWRELAVRHGVLDWHYDTYSNGN